MSDKQLAERVRQWMSEQGYPLEMRVAELFRDAGFSVVAPEYYTDPDSQKVREIDVVAYKSLVLPSGFVIWVTYVIECKASKKKEKPWILFLGSPYHHQFSKTGMPGVGLREDLQFPVTDYIGERMLFFAQGMLEHPNLSAPRHVGYGLVSMRHDNDDVTFSAVVTVMKAAVARLEQVEAQWRKHYGGLSTAIHIVVPLLVIDQHLFGCKLAKAGELNIDELESGSLCTSYPMKDQEGYRHIEIVTIGKLQSWLEEVTRRLDALKQYASSDSVAKDLAGYRDIRNETWGESTKPK